MNRRTLTALLITAFLCLAPSSARANGWDSVERCIHTTLWGAGIGCVAGLVVALCRRTGVGGLFGWTMGISLASGLGGLLIASLASAPLNPDFFGFAMVSMVLAGLVAGLGGATLVGLALAFRAIAGKKSGPDKLQPPASGGGENESK